MILSEERPPFSSMHVRHLRGPFVLLWLMLGAGAAAAQSIPGWETKQFAMERLDAERVRLMREVEVTGVGANAGQQIFADDLLWNIRTGELTAEGNVLLVSPTGRIAAERAVFNTKNGRGTFYTASGTASLGARGAQDRSMFGTLEPDVMFYGRMIEKIGDDRYRITNGAFTSCAQPTPRWEIVSSNATIDLEDYAVLRNAVIRVKNVPVFYLPILYYPIQSDDRATGFLMPSYGNSSYRGHSISNAFFWAINRSQDLTLFHDWLFTTGQGYGTEYRYTMGAGSEGQIRLYRLAENAGTVETSGGSVARDALRSLELRGNLMQQLPAGFRAYGRLDYFSNVTAKQLYQQDFYNVSQSMRVVSGGVSGALKTLSLSANTTRTETFSDRTSSYVNGTVPSIIATLSSRQFGDLPLFGSMQSEISNTLYQQKTGDAVTDNGLWRMEVWPSLRAPVAKLPFLTVNGTLSWRYTHFSERLVNRAQVPIGLHREYFDMGAEVAGPVFNRVFAPSRESARRIKHVFEPFVSVHRITAIPERDAIPITGGNDYVFGGNGTINYGFNNRIIMRSPPPDGEGAASAAQAAPRELVFVGLQQSYYTNAEASQFDPSYPLSYLSLRTHQYSPWSLTVRGAPSRTVSTDFRMEYDTTTKSNRLQGLTLNGTVNTGHVQASGGWSHRRFDAANTTSFIQSSTTVKTTDNALGGTFSFNYDIERSSLLQHRWIGYYNAQCCGVIVEYQEYNFGNVTLQGIPSKDRRFNLSFSLAGVGSFSNLFGAFGGMGGR